MQRTWFFSLSLLVWFAAAARAQFIYVTNGGAITITGYTGSGGAVTIPSVIQNLPVTGIGGGAFWGCLSVTNVAIPNSVTSIGSQAFIQCSNLAGVTFGDNVANIGDHAFAYCASLARLTIPDNVTNIGNYAFEVCGSLTNVTIGGRVATIGEGMFKQCGSLVGVTISAGITSMANDAFGYCGALAGIVIPGSVTSLGDDAFVYCNSLRTLYFQGNAPSADSTVFSGDANAVAYYLAGATGWNTWSGNISAVELNGIASAGSPTNGFPPLTVNFTSAGVDTVSNAISNWCWVFGDGSTSAAQNPSHTYSTLGTFHPVLFATNTIGATVFSSNSMSIGVVLTQPRIVSLGISVANLTIYGTNGVSGETYYTLMSESLTPPFSQWTPVATNVLGAGSGFTITISNAASRTIPQQYYILQLH